MQKLITSIMAIGTSLAMMAQSSSSSDLLLQYISLKDALVQSDAGMAAKAAEAFSASIVQMAKADNSEAMMKAAKTIVATTDIEKQRVAFAGLSNHMWELLKSDKQLQQDIYLQYCPMKKTYWLSKDPGIKNPYYGSKMLTCGSVKDKRIK